MKTNRNSLENWPELKIEKKLKVRQRAFFAYDLCSYNLTSSVHVRQVNSLKQERVKCTNQLLVAFLKRSSGGGLLLDRVAWWWAEGLRLLMMTRSWQLVLLVIATPRRRTSRQQLEVRRLSFNGQRLQNWKKIQYWQIVSVFRVSLWSLCKFS